MNDNISTLASAVRRSVYGLIGFELLAAGGSYLLFRHLRRSEKSRHYLYISWPILSRTYYWAEDTISFGQLISIESD
uniref:Uncharacterized protein n=1 Tax=Heterorhabditis bacteriophora TaxID=37862 RepID=A0A1I7XCE6_HETBA